MHINRSFLILFDKKEGSLLRRYHTYRFDKLLGINMYKKRTSRAYKLNSLAQYSAFTIAKQRIPTKMSGKDYELFLNCVIPIYIERLKWYTLRYAFKALPDYLTYIDDDNNYIVQVGDEFLVDDRNKE